MHFVRGASGQLARFNRENSRMRRHEPHGRDD